MKQVTYLCLFLTVLHAQESVHWYSPATHPYEPKPVAPANLTNAGRIESLLRDGKLYLSLQDAIALALENNIDIEVERYLFPLAQADLLRAQSGNSTQGISTNTSAGATGLSATSAQSFFLLSFTNGTANSFSSVNPNGYDPTVNGVVQWGHVTLPQQNTVTTGTTSLVSTSTVA